MSGYISLQTPYDIAFQVIIEDQVAFAVDEDGVEVCAGLGPDDEIDDFVDFLEAADALDALA
jgi:hypothetical protein